MFREQINIMNAANFRLGAKTNKMNRQEYSMMAELMLKVPPKSETPDGQNFHIGEIVRIRNANSWFAKKYNPDQFFEIQYSYSQKYGGSDDRNKNQYSLKHLFEENSSAWYDEDELELVKSINEINEEKDLSEYKRLKAKYEGMSNGS